MKTESNNTWDLSILYKSDNDPQIEKDRKIAKTKNEEFAKKWENDNRYLEDPATMLNAILEYENLLTYYNGVLSNEDLYFFLRTSEDTIDTNLKAKVNKSEALKTKLTNNIQFFTHKISKIPVEKQKIFLQYEPLSSYKHFLEKLFRQAKYLLSEAEEKLLLITTKTSHSNWVDMIEEFIYSDQKEFKDDKGKIEKVGFDKLLSIACYDADENRRDDATRLVNEILEKIAPLATKELNSILEYKHRIDELRGLERADIERLVTDDVDEKFIDTLLDAVSSRYDISQRLYKLKAKILGKKKIKYNERLLSVGSIELKFPYVKAKEYVLSVYKNFDKEVFEIVESFFDKRMIDVFPRKGKRGGGFCSISLVAHPVYIFLNHNDEISDVTTLAHELGHGVNHVMMKENNTELNYLSTKSTAEVASTFFEDFTLEEISKKYSEEERFMMLFKKLDSDISSIFRQIACYKFEQELHATSKEKGYISQEEIGEMFIKHMKAYMGNSVSYDKGSENWWVYWPHIRLYFYVYSYASGLLISKSLQSLVKADTSQVKSIKKFLREGGKKSPKDIFMEMGIDINSRAFWDKGIAQVESLLDEVEHLAKKLGKI